MGNILAGKERRAMGKGLSLPYALCSIICALAIYGTPCFAEAEAKAEAQGDAVEQKSAQPDISQSSGGETNAVNPFSNFRSPYADQRARQVGDIVTIIITESAKASKSSATKTSKKSGADGGLSELFGLGMSRLPMSMGVDASSDYSGAGSTTNSGSMEAKVSAAVKQVLPNGNLALEGSRQVTVNDDVQTITITGIVRPQDIMANNTVRSMYMADAKIGYVGDGPIAQRPGIVSRIIQTPFHLVSRFFRSIF